MNYNSFIKHTLKGITICLMMTTLCTVLIINRDLINPTVTAKHFWFYVSIGLLSLIIIPYITILQKKNNILIIGFNMSSIYNLRKLK